MSSGGESSILLGVQAVVGSGRLIIGRDADRSSGGRTGVEGGGYELYRHGYGQLVRWEDNLSNVILGADPNSPLSYALVLELHHPTMSMFGGAGIQFYREIYTDNREATDK